MDASKLLKVEHGLVVAYYNYLPKVRRIDEDLNLYLYLVLGPSDAISIRHFRLISQEELINWVAQSMHWPKCGACQPVRHAETLRIPLAAIKLNKPQWGKDVTSNFLLERLSSEESIYSRFYNKKYNEFILGGR